MPRGLGEDRGGNGLSIPGEGRDPMETPPGLLEMVTGGSEVSEAPDEVEIDALEVSEACEPLEHLGDLTGAGDFSVELVAKVFSSVCCWELNLAGAGRSVSTSF